MSVSARDVKMLRDRTGAGMMDCKKALVETGGDADKAVEYLRKKGIAKAEGKAGRETREGIVYAYIHPGSRVGVLIEVNCETDFVAKTDDFQALVKDLAMQVAAASPRWVSREDVPEDVLAKEREIYAGQLEGQGKPPQVIDKIIEGKINKWLSEVCLLEQPFIKDSDKTIQDVVTEAIAKLGENIRVARFVRFAVGESD